ncbi:MAG: 50S ribosomal protein L11 methyltransferase [Gammaproteobacteria bacterium]
MPWSQLEFKVRAKDLARAESLLTLAGADAIALGDAADAPLLEPAPGTTPVWPTIAIRALFSSATAARSIADAMSEELFVEGESVCCKLSEADWIDGLLQKPFRQVIGERLILLSPEEDAPADRVSVRLHRGLAFGTGAHPTTRLCLEWLDTHVTEETSIIDYGCGSGVLAISALRLGAHSAWAIDIEPQALVATRDNAELNEVSNRTWIGEPEKLPDIRAEILAANILAGTVLELSQRFQELVAPGGRILLSGILDEQADEVQKALSSGFGSFEKETLDGWVALSASTR